MKIEKVPSIKNKKYKEKEIIFFSAGSDLLDLTTGYFPLGMMNIVGDSSSGKSFLAGEIIANTYHKTKNFSWFYDDAEKGYKFDSKILYGFDVLKDGLLKEENTSETIEDFEKNIHQIISKKNKDDIFIYVLDSFEKLTSREEELYLEKNRDKEKREGTYGMGKASFFNQFCRNYVKKLVENKILLIIISQLRDKIGIFFGSPYTRQCERALNFYSNVVLFMKETEKYKKWDRTYGICVGITTKKARYRKPFRYCYLDFLFDYGIDNIRSNLKFLFDLKTETGKDKEKKEKKNLIWNNEEYTLENLISYIYNNNLEEELKNMVVDKWNVLEEKVLEEALLGRKRKW
jgi:RecA/RadA recombinase